MCCLSPVPGDLRIQWVLVGQNDQKRLLTFLYTNGISMSSVFWVLSPGMCPSCLNLDLVNSHQLMIKIPQWVDTSSCLEGFKFVYVCLCVCACVHSCTLQEENHSRHNCREHTVLGCVYVDGLQSHGQVKAWELKNLLGLPCPCVTVIYVGR